MNVVIIDGNIEKKDTIVNLLRQKDEQLRTRWFDNYRDSSMFIEEYHNKDNKENIDLIILDWSFPYASNTNYTFGNAALFLDYLKASNYNIRTFLFTSDRVNIDRSQYPFVEGIIPWSNDSSFVPSINPIFPDNTNEMHKVIDKRNKYSKLIKKPSDGRYKKRKASTPWWVK